MTTTDTMDTEGTVQQTLRMAASGAEYVRITAPSIKEAENLRLIKERLRALGCNVPLIADIHFTPNAAEVAARIVDYRTKKGPFKKVEELMNVQGIGEKSFLKLRSQLTVGGASAPAAQQQ